MASRGMLENLLPFHTQARTTALTKAVWAFLKHKSEPHPHHLGNTLRDIPVLAVSSVSLLHTFTRSTCDFCICLWRRSQVPLSVCVNWTCMARCWQTAIAAHRVALWRTRWTWRQALRAQRWSLGKITSPQNVEAKSLGTEASLLLGAGGWPG